MFIGIIGCGHLGKALISGLLKCGVDQKQIILNAKTKTTLDDIKCKYSNIEVAYDKKELVSKSDTIVIVVKPQNAKDVFDEIKDIDISEKTIISFMAGVTLKDISQMLNGNSSGGRIIRMMPNIGISLCNGVIGVSSEHELLKTEETLILFEQLGHLIYLPEEKLESITICVASGLAFAAYLMKEYKYSCNKLMDDMLTSTEIAMRVFENVIEIIRNEESTFETLIEQISTKGGTTEAGINVLKASDFNKVIDQCLEAAYNRVNGLKGD